MKSKNIVKLISTSLLGTMLFYTMPVLAYTKDETVYSKMNNNGDRYKTIVSTYLQNNENEELIKDMTNLINIKNTNGDEEFNQNDNELIWKSNKNDIYYQGESNKELPIKINIKYYLNEKELNSNEIVGKDGKVKVVIEYINKDEHLVNINGKNQKMYTPFVVIAGTIINNENNKNIEVTNGKVINDGSKTIITAMCMPGLQESLDISKDKLDIPSTIEITMDAKNFEMSSILNMVTPKIIEKDDLKLFDDMEKIYKDANTLKSSSIMIEEGANKLKDGTNEYKGKMKEFESAINQISDGMKKANDNYAKINDGISQINSNNGQINSGAKKVFEGISLVGENLNTINEKLNEVLVGTKGLKNGEKELIAGIDKILGSIDKIPEVDNTSKINDLTKLISGNKLAIQNLTNVNKALELKLKDVKISKEEIISIKTQIESNKQLIELLNKNIFAEEETIKTLKSVDNKQILELKLGLNKVKEGLIKLENGTDSLANGVSRLNEGTNTLNKKTKELISGANTLYNGTNKMSGATKILQSGSNEMKKGLGLLDLNGNKIVKANSLLTKGAEDINNGAVSLADGITKFNKDGINKVCNYINGDLKNMQTRLEKLDNLSKEYKNFTMLKEGANGNVKFIMIVDALNKKDEKQNIVIDDNKNKEEKIEEINEKNKGK